jgi:hypothetical protein
VREFVYLHCLMKPASSFVPSLRIRILFFFGWIIAYSIYFTYLRRIQRNMKPSTDYANLKQRGEAACGKTSMLSKGEIRCDKRIAGTALLVLAL